MTETSDYRERERQQLLEQQVTTRCRECQWSWTGAFADARAMFDQHVRSEHPKLARKRKPLPAVDQRIRAGVCKRPDCGRPQAGPTQGPHAYLCDHHIEEQRQARTAAKAGSANGQRNNRACGPKLPSSEAALEQLRAWHRQHGRPPTSKECEVSVFLPSPTALRRLFGGLIAALDQAGVPRPDMFKSPAAPVASASFPDAAGDGTPAGAGTSAGGGGTWGEAA